MDKPLERTPDIQCFRYDHLQRLTSAWTPGAAAEPCKADPSTGNLAGPAQYWQSFAYDKLGNRITDTMHSAQGNTGRRARTHVLRLWWCRSLRRRWRGRWVLRRHGPGLLTDWKAGRAPKVGCGAGLSVKLSEGTVEDLAGRGRWIAAGPVEVGQSADGKVSISGGEGISREIEALGLAAGTEWTASARFNPDAHKNMCHAFGVCQPR